MFGDREGVPTRQVVAIESVNTTRWEATGITRYGSRILLNLDFMWAGVLTVPGLGEQWLVEKYLGSFILVGRVGFQDERRMLDLKPGDTVFGLRGVTHLYGEEVVVEGESGLTSRGVGVYSPPTVTLKTTTPLQTSRTGPVEFEQFTGDSSFSVEGSDLTVGIGGSYQFMSNFYVPGLLKLRIQGLVVREFSETSNFTLVEQVVSGSQVSLEYVPRESVNQLGSRVNGSLTLLRVGH